MGLDFSHGEAHWSYSGFHEFRLKLAKAAGFYLSKMKGFGGIRPWNEIKDDIVPLLDHSDCDGELTVAQCKKVAPRLRELVKDWSDDDFDKGSALELADAMDEAVSENTPLKFQ